MIFSDFLRYKRATSLVLLWLAAGCGGGAHEGPQVPQQDLDAGEADAHQEDALDGDVSDASEPEHETLDASPDAGKDARPDPNAPPSTLHGKKLYTVRFDSRAGSLPFACGKTVSLGTKATQAEPVDIRFYVHDVTLVRASGERVALELHQDERYQRENVALLDFTDDTGKCLTGDSDIRNVVHGYAPEQSDYTGVAFKVGVPADKNHLDGAHAAAPYNASGMWWSWSGGYKYMRIDITSEPQPIWYFHGGAANCGGNVNDGFTCFARQIAQIELSNYDPAASLVVFDATRFYAASDITIGDATPGCMGFPPDDQCAPLYNTLGVVPWDDATKGPAQSAFVLTTGPQLVVSRGATTPERKTDDPTAWPNPSYERPAVLDRDNASKAGGTSSHPPTDPRYGSNCMRCHQEHGPGIGRFSAAGTVVDSAGKPASFAKVEVFSGDVVGYGEFAKLVSQALLEVDANGNFFTTAPLPLDSTEVSARILGSDGQALITMPFTQSTAACNNCHTGGMRLTVPAP